MVSGQLRSEVVSVCALLGVVAACRSTPRPETVSESPPPDGGAIAARAMTEARDDASAHDDGIAPCAGTPAAPVLDSYLSVRVPGTVWVEMTFTDGEWRPATFIPMPHHHATRLELTNIGDFPALTGRTRERLRFTLEITSRDVRQVPGRQQWRATYFAAVRAVCIPDPATRADAAP